MILFRSVRRVAALAAIFALALQALWPLVAQARPRIAGELVPVCTIEGVTHYLELPAGKSPLEERSASHGEHCQLCVFGAERNVAPVFQDEFLVSQPETSRPSSRVVPGTEPLDHPPAQPRAPPASL